MIQYEHCFYRSISKYIILNNNNLHSDSESEYAQSSTKNYLFVNFLFMFEHK